MLEAGVSNIPRKSKCPYNHDRKYHWKNILGVFGTAYEKEKKQNTVLCGLRVTQKLFPQFYLANEVIQTVRKVALVTPVLLDAEL